MPPENLARFFQSLFGDIDQVDGDVAHAAARDLGLQAQARHVAAQALVVGDIPILDQIPGGGQRRRVVQHPDPQGGQGADAAPRSAVGAAHLQIGFQSHLGEEGGQVVVPVLEGRIFAGQGGQFPGLEIAERLARGVDVFAVALGEIHRRVQGVVGIAFEAETVLVHEAQHAGAVGVGVGPDVGAGRQEAVGPSLGEGRTGEQGRGDGLQRQGGAELHHHVGFGIEVQVRLDGASAQHHVQTQGPDLGHIGGA